MQPPSTFPVLFLCNPNPNPFCSFVRWCATTYVPVREQVTMLDRWSVSAVTTSKGGFRKGQKDRQLIMNNYLGIGVDGQVALDFHKVCALFSVHKKKKKKN